MADPAKSKPRKVILKGTGIRSEYNAGAQVFPGELVEFSALNTVQPHGTAAVNAAPMFVHEDDFLGNDIDTAIASGDRVQVIACHAGMQVNAKIANTVNVAVGDFLESAGDGTLRPLGTDAATDDTQRRSVVAQALEAVNNTSGADAFLQVQVV